jgi:hypothetical protein
MRTAIILAIAALSGCATTTFTDGTGRQIRCEASAGEKFDIAVRAVLGDVHAPVTNPQKLRGQR